MKYSVVIPCYRSSMTIGKVVNLIREEFPKMDIDDYEIVLVNDCSPDEGKTINVLHELADEDNRIKVVDLGKNSGQHNAIMAALRFATGDRIVALDDDMQTHPSQLKKLIEKMDAGYDIVYGYYEEKKESLFRRFGSAVNYWTVRVLIGKPKWMKTSSYWLIKKYVRDYAIEYNNPCVHLQGVFLRVTRNIACVPIEHFEREVGTSTYTLKKLLQLYSNIVGFSEIPLRIVMWFGVFVSIIGFLASLVIIIRKIINPLLVVGWSSMMAAMCFFSGLILLSIGIVGLYVGRLFINVTNKPQYVIRELRNIDEEEI